MVTTQGHPSPPDLLLCLEGKVHGEVESVLETEERCWDLRRPGRVRLQIHLHGQSWLLGCFFFLCKHIVITQSVCPASVRALGEEERPRKPACPRVPSAVDT